MPETKSSVPAFRGDIQGMRALAVLTVIACHAGLTGFTGGYVGVDVFFVVSGFLITQLIVSGVSRTGRFSIGTFYARRARRILPAASVILVVTTLASVLYLNFIDALDATEDAVWAAFFLANFRFGAESTDYFSLDESPSPFQHYWSLSVEEQFYVVWPVLVLLLVWLWLRTPREPGQAPTRMLAIVATVLGVASFVYSLILTGSEPVAAYFSSVARGWELAAGAIAALLLWGSAGLKGRLPVELVGWGGLIAIGIAVVTFDATTAFPGTAALLPVLGTVAMLVAGANPDNQPSYSQALAGTPLRQIGDWSYSLYLWHWPLLVVPAVRLGRDLTPTETCIAVALTFQMAYLTYRFVEQPFRTGQFWKVRSRGLVLYPVSLALVLPALFGSHSWASYLGSERGDNPAIAIDPNDSPRDEVVGLVRASVLAAQNDDPIPSDLTPDVVDLKDAVADVGECNYNTEEWKLCLRGDVTGDKTMVLTGDSHARMWIPAFEEIAKANGYQAYYLVKPKCTAPFVLPGLLGSGEPWPECVDYKEFIVDKLTELRPELLVVTTAPPPEGVYTDDGEQVTEGNEFSDMLAEGYDEMFDTYQDLVDRVVMISDVPRLAGDPSSCLADRDADMGDCTFEPISRARQKVDISISAASRAEVDIIDPTPWLCADNLCPSVIGSTITYRDPAHITTDRAHDLWQALQAELQLGPDAIEPKSDKPRTDQRNVQEDDEGSDGDGSEPEAEPAPGNRAPR